MKRLLLLSLLISTQLFSQNVMTPEKLWSLGRVGAIGISEDQNSFYYQVSTPSISENDFDKTYFEYVFEDGGIKTIEEDQVASFSKHTSPDGKWEIVEKRVKVLDVLGSDIYPQLEETDAHIYDNLQHRHWDTWSDGMFNHLILVSTNTGDSIDIMEGEKHHCPTMPFGGSEDYTWSPDSKSVIYVCKKKFGAAYMNSTNTDLYSYDLETGKTSNLTDRNAGYDTNPVFSKDGKLAYLSMARDGYESDKNDIKVLVDRRTINLTERWDGTAREIIWGEKGENIFFTAPVDGTIQLFMVDLPKGKKLPEVKQLTKGVWDLGGIVGWKDKDLIIGRTDMNHAREYYSVNVKKGSMEQLTHVNDDTYKTLDMSKVEARDIETVDGKQMHTWIIYPPNFDPNKKYPTLLYTQGGPQSPLSQFYSFRWNFQIMAANGYIVVAPNRRGMPGHGVEWNEQISKDWGGLNMQDYLAAIDAMAKEPFVDEDRLGCVGASYGGYSAFFLAGIHENRFKTFISHDGVFDLHSMYGTTEELFFPNWDIGGPYWELENEAAQKSYNSYDPKKYVTSWNTPILIIQGGKDYRVPIGQGLEAFTVAQQLGIKSRFLYFPSENHWILTPQNGIVWQNEFFRWLRETL